MLKAFDVLSQLNFNVELFEIYITSIFNVMIALSIVEYF